MIAEGALTLEDGSFVILQLLQGVLENVELVQDSLSGVPLGQSGTACEANTYSSGGSLCRTL